MDVLGGAVARSRLDMTPDRASVTSHSLGLLLATPSGGLLSCPASPYVDPLRHAALLRSPVSFSPFKVSEAASEQLLLSVSLSPEEGELMGLLPCSPRAAPAGGSASRQRVRAPAPKPNPAAAGKPAACAKLTVAAAAAAAETKPAEAKISATAAAAKAAKAKTATAKAATAKAKAAKSAPPASAPAPAPTPTRAPAPAPEPALVAAPVHVALATAAPASTTVSATQCPCDDAVSTCSDDGELQMFCFAAAALLGEDDEPSRTTQGRPFDESDLPARMRLLRGINSAVSDAFNDVADARFASPAALKLKPAVRAAATPAVTPAPAVAHAAAALSANASANAQEQPARAQQPRFPTAEATENKGSTGNAWVVRAAASWDSCRPVPKDLTGGDGPRGVPSSLQMRERKRAAPLPSKEDDVLARKRAAPLPSHLVVQQL
jgi:hypothetical protein